MLRRTRLLVWTSLSAIVLLAAGSLLRADDPPAPTPPPGYKVVYRDIGGGKKAPIFVRDQVDMSGVVRNAEDDPLDHQKAFSATNVDANKTFMPATATGMDKSSDVNPQQTFDTKVYDTTGPANVYNLGSKSTFRTASYDGTKTAAGYDQNFATKSAPPDLDKATTAFAPIGDSDQNRTAPIDAKTYDTFANPMADKTYMKAVADNSVHHNLGELGSGTPLSEIPNRPLSIDEVRDLINHGFKPNLSQPPAPESKPMNDPNYQAEPLRIEPTSADDALPLPVPAPSPGSRKVDDDDANDPVPSPGTMAEPPENSEPLPSK